MTQLELQAIKDQLKRQAENTLLAKLDIHGIGAIELEIESKNSNQLDSGLLQSVLEYVIRNLHTIKLQSNQLLNALAGVKGFNQGAPFECSIVGISINNDAVLHDRFKLVFDYDAALAQQNEDSLGYRTVHFSGDINYFYLSGVNWVY